MTAGLVNRGLTARREAEMEAKRENEAKRVMYEDDMLFLFVAASRNTVRNLNFKSEEK